MLLNALVLFLSVVIPGLLLMKKLSLSEKRMSYFLVFAGAYLFAMTIIHLIPDVFLSGENPFNLGLWILLGFFLQKVIENFSSGVEHGHAHVHGSGISVTYLLLALSLHSFLEGTIMSEGFHANHLPHAGMSHGGANKILLGIVMHKIPAAFALMAILKAKIQSSIKAFLLLMVFALASPLGLMAAEYFLHEEFINEQYMVIFFAIVAGGFLQISTTIFIESDPNHKLHWQKFGIAVMGASLAVIGQLFV